MSKSLGGQLKQARKKRHLSEQDMAQRMRVSVFDIQDIESGKKPVPVAFIVKLAKVFELSSEKTKKLIQQASAQHRFIEVQTLTEKHAYATMLLQYHIAQHGDNPKLDSIIQFMEQL